MNSRMRLCIRMVVNKRVASVKTRISIRFPSFQTEHLWISFSVDLKVYGYCLERSFGELKVHKSRPSDYVPYFLRFALCLLVDAELFDASFDIVHEPHRSGSGSADADALFANEPFGAEFVFARNEVRIGVCVEAFGKKYLSVATFLATNEDDELVGGCKFANFVDTVGHLSANGVVAFESVLVGVASSDFAYNFLEAL